MKKLFLTLFLLHIITSTFAVQTKEEVLESYKNCQWKHKCIEQSENNKQKLMQTILECQKRSLIRYFFCKRKVKKLIRYDKECRDTCLSQKPYYDDYDHFGF